MKGLRPSEATLMRASAVLIIAGALVLSLVSLTGGACAAEFGPSNPGSTIMAD